MKKETLKKNGIRLAVCVYVLVLFLLNFIRIFDNNFWGDEAYTIRLAKLRFSGMLSETAQDVHPPLYYILVRLICRLLGYRGEIFHLASLVPYMIILGLALTVIRKRFGQITALLFVTMASLLPMAVQYNVEIRMYSWGALFVLLSYLFLQKILTNNQWTDYLWFAIFSLAAAYTHYYCLISVAFFYGTLLLYAAFRRKNYLKKTLVCCVCTVAGYLPWFFILLKTFERTTEDFWMMWIPTLKDCIAFLFNGRCQYLLFAILITSSALFLIKQIQESEWNTLIWVMGGLFSIFGTVFVGIMVSRLIRPLFIVRYLYPVSVIAWLLLGYCLSKLKGKIIYAIAVFALVFVSGIWQYIDTYTEEKAENERLKETLAATAGKMTDQDVILTDLLQIDWTVADYYYPGIPRQLVTFEADQIPEPVPAVTYWLVLGDGQAQKNVSLLEDRGYFCDEIIKDGILGTSAVCIYRLEVR